MTGIETTQSEPVVEAPDRPGNTRVYGPDPKKVGWRVLVDLRGAATGKHPRKGIARAVFGGGMAMLVVGAVLAFASVASHVPSPSPVDPEYGKLAEEGRLLIEDVKGVLAGYFSAPTPEVRLAFVCEPERVRPLMEDHYAFHPMPVRTVERVEIHATMTRFKTTHAHLFASVIDSGNTVSVAILRQYVEGVRIDWEATEAYNALDLKNVIRLHPEGDTVLRVMARPSEYYNFEFIDDGVWQAFVLWNPNEPDTRLHGYCRRDGQVCQSLLDLTAGGHAVAARVVVGFSPELNGDDLVEIREIVAPHWFGGDA